MTASIELVYAESYRSVLNTYSTLLSSRGYKVIPLASGAELKTYFEELQAKSQRPHVLLLDPLFSDIKGFEIMQHVRHQYPEMKIVVMSGHPKCLQQATESKYVDLVITKPVSASCIDYEIRKLLTGLVA
jgi:CheY-like chemotaxis protein